MERYLPEQFGLTPGWGVAGNAERFQAHYDTLAAGAGGLIHFPSRYYFTRPLHLHSGIVAITGDGPGTGFWFQLDDPTQDAFVVRARSGDPFYPFLQMAEMSGFSVLGGANCARNLVSIRFIVRSRFTNLHVLGGTTGNAIAIGTGWCNEFGLVVSCNLADVYAPTAWGRVPGTPGSDFVRLLENDRTEGGLNANRFDLLVEGASNLTDANCLLRIDNQNGPNNSGGNWTDQGNNWLSGTLEGKPKGYGLQAVGCECLCMEHMHVEGTLGVLLQNCTLPTFSQSRWFTTLNLVGCLAPAVVNSAGNALNIDAGTTYATLGNLVVGQGPTGTVTDNGTGTVTSGPILNATTKALLGGAVATSVADAPLFANQTAIVGTAAYLSTGTASPADWQQVTPKAAYPTHRLM